MKVILGFDCDHCIDDLSLEFSVSGKHLPTMREVRAEADKVGWKIGARVFCPTCYAKLPAHCDTCEYYEGNKTMGAPYCRKRKCFVCPTDYCEDHNGFSETDKPLKTGYQNPIPTIE